MKKKGVTKNSRMLFNLHVFEAKLNILQGPQIWKPVQIDRIGKYTPSPIGGKVYAQPMSGGGGMIRGQRNRR
jgi:hypothetical protein